jgi:hypothetical protein
MLQALSKSNKYLKLSSYQWYYRLPTVGSPNYFQESCPIIFLVQLFIKLWYIKYFLLFNAHGSVKNNIKCYMVQG